MADFDIPGEGSSQLQITQLSECGWQDLIKGLDAV
jgi:hypothetical protein